jgi:hypothetical protein
MMGQLIKDVILGTHDRKASTKMLGIHDGVAHTKECLWWKTFSN